MLMPMGLMHHRRTAAGERDRHHAPPTSSLGARTEGDLERLARVVVVVSRRRATMPRLTHWSGQIHEGGGDTGPVVATITTTVVTPRWLRFLPAHVQVTITGLDEVEAWARGARTAQQAQVVHDALVAKYKAKAREISASTAACIPADLSS
jgi:hypothetical protein